MEERERQNGRKEKLARDVLRLSRNTLLVNLRFLDMALSVFKLIPCEKSTYMTDGEHLIFNPEHVLKGYQVQREIPVRDYLHIVLHCIYRHMFMNPMLDRPIWDLACDIAVENIISELGLRATEVGRGKNQQREVEKLKKELKFLTAEKIYSYYKNLSLSPEKAAELRGLFYADNHEIWYMTAEEIKAAFGVSTDNGEPGDSESKDGENGGGSGDGESSDCQNGDGQNGGGSGDGESGDGQNGDGDSKDGQNGDGGNGNGQNGDGDSKDGQNGSGETGNGDSEGKRGGGSSRNGLESLWKDISEHIQQDMMTFSNGRYGNAGSMLQNLKEVNRERYDYTEFLKRFAVMGEVMKINDDEFDYVFYTYGMQLYKKMPLIEPLEYKEVKRIKDFVIAIDTSGSVFGDLVQSFVKKTYNVLKSTESFFSKINLHIIQCDTEIQEDVTITSQEEFDRYIKTMKLHGFGGNNEVRLFSYVDELIAAKQFTNLKGMIYFTDGYGIFPKHKPNYEVAFVFVNDRYEIPEVPPWVIKLVLQKDEI